MDHLAALDLTHACDHRIAARARLDALTADVGGAQLFGPKVEMVNPFLRALGHVARFQERLCLRAHADGSLGASILDRADALYDWSAVAHWTRWHLPSTSLAETRRDLAEALIRTPESLDSCGTDPRQICFAAPRRMLQATWRNFFMPDRADVVAGLRTCALEA